MAVGASVLAGCWAAGSGPRPGSLILDNGEDQNRTVTVSITKTSDDTRHADQTPTPETTPIWEREGTFTAEADSRTVEPGFVDEPGAFFVEASLPNGSTDSNWVSIVGSSEGSGLASGSILVDLPEDGELAVRKFVRV